MRSIKSKPELRQVESDQSELMTVSIDQCQHIPKLAPAFAYAGEHFCWVTPFTEDKQVKILNTKTNKMRVFDPSKFMDTPEGKNVLVYPCDPMKLLVQGFALNLDKESIR